MAAQRRSACSAKMYYPIFKINLFKENPMSFIEYETWKVAEGNE